MNRTERGRAVGSCRFGRRGGAVLLEVVLALALFVMTAMVVLGGIGTSTETVMRLRQEAHAVDLATSILSQVQLGVIDPSSPEAGGGEFEPPFEQWTWSITTETPLEAAGGPLVEYVTVTVAHKTESVQYSLTELFPIVTGDELLFEQDLLEVAP